MIGPPVDCLSSVEHFWSGSTSYLAFTSSLVGVAAAVPKAALALVSDFDEFAVQFVVAVAIGTATGAGTDTAD